MQRIMSLDFGEKRIGVAVSDPLNIIAQSVGIIERKGIKKDLKKIGEIVKEYGAERIIVGLPLNMDGTEGKSANRAMAFVKDLKKEVQVEVEMLDERLTTAQGERVFLEADMSRKKRRENLDKIAAQLILQSYLDSHSHKGSVRRSENSDRRTE